VKEVRLLVVRQPIFNRAKRVVGYELLFHALEGRDLNSSSIDKDQASRWVVDAYLHLFRPPRLTGGKLAFVPAPLTMLMQDLVIVLPPSHSVLQVDANETGDDLIEVCFRFKVTGYPIAVKNFLPWAPVYPLVAIANILKVDLGVVTGTERQRAVTAFGTPTRKLLAERVETMEDFLEAERAGYDYFQGSFFCQPESLSSRVLPSHKFTYLRVLHLLSEPDWELGRVEQVLKTDPSLAFKLLRFVNSAAVGIRHRVSTLRHALVLLGERLLRRWLLVAVTTLLLEDKPCELLVTALVRGSLCEQIAQALRLPSDPDPFLCGLFSVLDALLDQPLTEIVEDLPLSTGLKDALLGLPTPLGRIYALVRAYERAEWETVKALAGQLSLPEQMLSTYYKRAVQWTDQLFAQEETGLPS